MSTAIEKTVVTLSDLLVVEAQRLMQRRQSTIAWLDLLKPVIERSSGRVEAAGRFDRHEGVPQQRRPVPVDRPEDAEREESEGEPLDPMTRDRMRHFVGPEVELARIHDDRRADAFARRQRADAVTVGKDIYFRSGAFAPQSPAGLGLIAHELTHVAESDRPGAGWRRTTPDGVRDEERLARGREQSASQFPVSPVAAPSFAPRPASPVVAPSFASRPASPVTVSPVVPRGSSATVSQTPQLRPMRADADRPPTDAPAPAPQQAPNPDEFRRSLLRDVMNQIRVEFERGA